MPKGFVIAIDGPVASGKGTLAHKLADELDAFYVYTGGTYRSVALACLQNGIDLHNKEAVIAALPNIKIEFIKRRIVLNGQDVTDRIKESDAAKGSSVVAVIPEVRKQMVQLQQQTGNTLIEQGKIVVIEGRDTATVVFPDAKVRIYLTASETERAQRRLDQYGQQGEERKFEDVLEEIRIRDKRDKEREMDPLASNPEELGYYILDNTGFTQRQTLDTIKKELEKRGLL